MELKYQWVVGWAGKWAKTPVSMKTRVRISGTALIGRRENLAYVGQHSYPLSLDSQVLIGAKLLDGD